MGADTWAVRHSDASVKWISPVDEAPRFAQDSGARISSSHSSGESSTIFELSRPTVE